MVLDLLTFSSFAALWPMTMRSIICLPLGSEGSALHVVGGSGSLRNAIGLSGLVVLRRHRCISICVSWVALTLLGGPTPLTVMANRFLLLQHAHGPAMQGGVKPLPVVCSQDPGSATAVGQPQYLRTRSERWTHAARSHVCWRLGGFPVVLVVDRELVVVV